MSADPTGTETAFDPTVQRMTGVTAHGRIPFDVPVITEIAPNLWQGGCEEGLILPRFVKHHVSLYASESYDVHHRLDSSLSVRLLDAAGQDMSMVDDIARWVIRRKTTGPTLVNCQAGLNRSGLVVARVLMLDGATADDAIRIIREKRSPACLCNKAFEEWLRSAPGPEERREELEARLWKAKVPPELLAGILASADAYAEAVRPGDPGKPPEPPALKGPAVHYGLTKHGGVVRPACRPGDTLEVVGRWPMTATADDVNCKGCRKTDAWQAASRADPP